MIGRPVREALPEIEGQGYFELLDEVYRTGEPRALVDAPAMIRHPEGLIERTIEFVYQPIHWRIDNFAIKPWVTGVPKNKQGYIVPNNALFVRQWDRIMVTDDSPHDPPK